ncbi:acyl-ACP--UDP-N-acetylglucosamine O-acyltransferase [Candidatus Dependentiae bacterium]|nr:acyl-ACP--UDP-N-acetylglucosamine O-acyltransferase [Candidatus Dependentiae bacterium]
METPRKTLKKSLIKNHLNQFEEDFFNSKKTYIHPSAIVGKNVQLGNNVKIGPFSVLTGNIEIADNSVIHSHVSIGSPAQNLETSNSLGKIKIGKNVRIREFSRVGASKFENGQTTIGDNCYIMSYCHVGHDVTLEKNVTLINNVNLGGHVHVGKNAFLMANTAAHQFCRIGEYCSLAPYSAIRQDLPPYCMFSGLPAKFFGLNLIALKRAKFSRESINAIKHVAKLFYQDKFLLKDIINKAKEEISWGNNNFVKNFLNFIENSNRGVSRKIDF